MHIDPCIPKAWPGYEATITWRSARYHITVENPLGVGRGVASLRLDGADVTAGRPLPLTDDGGLHAVRVVLGNPAIACVVGPVTS